MSSFALMIVPLVLVLVGIVLIVLNNKIALIIFNQIPTVRNTSNSFFQKFGIDLNTPEYIKLSIRLSRFGIVFTGVCLLLGAFRILFNL